VVGYAVEAAKVPFQWVECPSGRQIQMLKEHPGWLAALGWFRNPERETFAKFSVPLYQDRRMAVLARRDNARIEAAASVDALLRDPGLSLLVKQGYSYGEVLDGKIARFQPRSQVVTGENLNMIAMIEHRHADYMFIAPEEARAAIKASGFPEADIQVRALPRMPPGQKRYLLYSRAVDDATIARIDKYIREYLARRR
jgi:hypothetical protein